MLALALAAGCAQPPAADLVARAIRARGGPLPAFTREAEARVFGELAGVWTWRIALLGPARLRLTLVTSGEDQHWECDGREARTYLGTALVSREALEQSPVASLARWTELVHLDALADESRFAWTEMPAPNLPAGAAHGLVARCVATDCGTYRIFFDEKLRLVAAEGPLEIPTLEDADVQARFRDFRTRDGLELPFEVQYDTEGARFLDERVVAFDIDRN